MSEIFDSWADDWKAVDPGELTPRLEALAENDPPPLPAKGQARQRRIDKIQNELNEIQAFVNDCDRWAEGTRDIVLVGNEVRVLMEGKLGVLRRKAVARGSDVYSELQYLRSLTT